MVDHEETNNDEKAEKSKTENTAQYGDSNWKPLKKSLTNSEILAQSIVFFAAGNETTAATLNFASYCCTITFNSCFYA